MSYRVMQIETSNFCTLRCTYCPHPNQVRAKGDMTFETFRKCIAVVKASDNPVQDGRTFVWLNHFGEPLLNPLLPDFIRYAVSQGVDVCFSSNGVDGNKKLFPRELWQKLADAGLKGVMLSAHAKSGWTLRRHVGSVLKVIGVWKPKKAEVHDWAGQVKIDKFVPGGIPQPSATPCDYQTSNMFAIRWDGKLAACCYDVEGGLSLSVDDVLANGFAFAPIKLCGGCTLGRGDTDFLTTPLRLLSN